MSRYTRRPAVHTMGADRNAGPLKAYAEALGLSVEPVPGGDGRPDWDVGGWGVDAKAEVKPEWDAADGVFARETNLREKQDKWHKAWRGARPFVIRTHADVLEMANTMREWSRRMGK